MAIKNSQTSNNSRSKQSNLKYIVVVPLWSYSKYQKILVSEIFSLQCIINNNIGTYSTKLNTINVYSTYFVDFIVLWFEVYRTHKIGESHIIQTNKLTTMLHIKYNGKMYYSEVPEISKHGTWMRWVISKHSWKYELFYI